MYNAREKYPDIIKQFPELEFSLSNKADRDILTGLERKLNDLLNKVDRDLLSRIAGNLTSLKVELLTSGEQIGLQVAGDIKNDTNALDEPRVHVEVTLADVSAVVIFSLVFDNQDSIPVNLLALSYEQRLQIASISQEINNRLWELFGSQADLNDILKNGGTQSILFSSKQYQRKQGGIRDL